MRLREHVTEPGDGREGRADIGGLGVVVEGDAVNPGDELAAVAEAGKVLRTSSCAFSGIPAKSARAMAASAFEMLWRPTILISEALRTSRPFFMRMYSAPSFLTP